MAELKYKFTNDVLFKWLFINNQDLLKRLVAEMLKIEYNHITEFEVTNQEIPPDIIENKLCRLDINMKVNGRRIDLEMQASDDGTDYPERSLYYWAREYSSALKKGGIYDDLPQTIVISILGYKQFPCTEFYSEFQALEITRYTQLTDRFCLKYYELPKFPDVTDTQDELKLWLTLFKAKTEEDLEKIEAMGVPVMEQAVGAYRTATSDEEFQKLERMRFDASNIEASRLAHALKTEKKKTAKKLLAMNLPIEQIVIATGLIHDEIIALRDGDN